MLRYLNNFMINLIKFYVFSELRSLLKVLLIRMKVISLVLINLKTKIQFILTKILEYFIEILSFSP